MRTPYALVLSSERNVVFPYLDDQGEVMEAGRTIGLTPDATTRSHTMKPSLTALFTLPMAVYRSDLTSVS